MRFLQEYYVSFSFTAPGEHSSSFMKITYAPYVQETNLNKTAV